MPIFHTHRPSIFTVKPLPPGGRKGYSSPLPPKRGGKIQKSGRLQNCGVRRLPAQSFQFFEVGVYFAFSIELVVIVCPQILEVRAVFQHMINGNQHGMCNRNISAFLPSMGTDSLKLRIEIGIFHLDRRMCSDNQRRTQQGVSLSGFP